MALKHTREEGRFLKSFKIMIIYMQHYIYKIRPEWVKLKKIKLLHLHLLLNTASCCKFKCNARETQMFVAGTRFTEVISSLTFGSIATRMSFLRKKKLNKLNRIAHVLTAASNSSPA